MKLAIRQSSALSDFLSALDRHFADFITRVNGNESEEVWLAAALASHFTQEGHVCLDLASIAGQPVGAEAERSIRCPELAAWVRSLRESPVVGAPGEFRPLVLDNAHRLYLYRYWAYEAALAAFLKRQAGRPPRPVDTGRLKENLSRLFPPQPGEPDWQRVAAVTALRRSFCVITGGPGTGKTSTVVRILALLAEQLTEKRISVVLAAPTGKAAARLKEAVRKAKLSLACTPDVVRQIPDEALTLHRMLGALPGSSRFRYHERNLLPYDVIVVDEASMIDLPLMAKLVRAMPEESRLVLLGDKDQLASVEPGAVFGDICSVAEAGGARGRQLAESLEVGETAFDGRSKPTLADSVVALQKSYRFDPASGIGRLSRSIQAGDQTAILELLASNSSSGISWGEVRSPAQFKRSLETWVLESYSGYLKAESAEEALASFEACRILCALRKGPFGVIAVNLLVEEILAKAGLIVKRGRWYRGQPLMVNHNDYILRLFNGDVGLVLESPNPEPGAAAPLRAFFPAEEGALRNLLPSKLPEHETVYAMTVHKAQGSEFERVLLLLPDQVSELLTRELIYTGITRARKQVEIWGSLDVLREAVTRNIIRKSGLRDALMT